MERKKSELKSDFIRKVIENQKDYKINDYEFKVTKKKPNSYFNHESFNVEVYHFGKKILEIHYTKFGAGVVLNPYKNKKKKGYVQKDMPEEYDFDIIYFNPQTDNDVLSSNHIIAGSREYLGDKFNHKDKGNLDVLDNEYVFRKKRSFYSYPLIWKRGKIADDNFDRDLSFSQATNEYIYFIKKINEFKRFPRKKVKTFLKDIVSELNKKKILDNLDDDD